MPQTQAFLKIPDPLLARDRNWQRPMRLCRPKWTPNGVPGATHLPAFRCIRERQEPIGAPASILSNKCTWLKNRILLAHYLRTTHSRYPITCTGKSTKISRTKCSLPRIHYIIIISGHVLLISSRERRGNLFFFELDLIYFSPIQIPMNFCFIMIKKNPRFMASCTSSCHSTYTIQTYEKDFTGLTQIVTLASGQTARVPAIPPGVHPVLPRKLPLCKYPTQSSDFAHTNTELKIGREVERRNALWRAARRLALPQNFQRSYANSPSCCQL